MKKFLLALISLVLVLSMASCDLLFAPVENTTTRPTTSSTTTTTTTTTTTMSMAMGVIIVEITAAARTTAADIAVNNYSIIQRAGEKLSASSQNLH